jgi:hypothetical protein
MKLSILILIFFLWHPDAVAFIIPHQTYTELQPDAIDSTE